MIGQNFGQAAEHAAPSGSMWKHQGHGVGRGLPHSEAVRVHELLECPVCTEAMLPPIYQVRELFESNEAVGLNLGLLTWGCSNLKSRLF